MRVVFDTNILISAAFWRGALYGSLLAAHAGLADLVLFPPILAELNRVLIEKFLDLLMLRSYQGVEIITARASLDKLHPPPQ